MTKGKYIRTKEIREKIGNSLKNKKRPKDVCDKLSKIAIERHIAGNFGMKWKKHSEETKEKMKNAHLGKKYREMSLEGRKNISDALVGRTIPNSTRKKMSIAKTGSNSPSWKGGISINSHSTKEPKYKKQLLSIFYRDNYVCQDCGKSKCYIEAHHINSWAKYPSKRYIISNGKTLCKECHKLTPSFGGKKN